MRVVREIGVDGYEQVFRLEDATLGLRGYLAVHSTSLGPALGGIRVLHYAAEEEALADALKLSRAMTYKTALAEIPAGGGKTVLMDHTGLNRVGAFETLGEIIESLGGRYFCGPDAGVTPTDLAAVATKTRYVADESSPQLGNIAEHTAVGVWHGMRACLEFAGIRRGSVAIQGVGSVGMCLARIVKQEGMELAVADLDRQRASRAAEELGAEVVSPEEILFAASDVLAPCALGDVLNSETIPQLSARIVCGSANNMLAAPEDGDALLSRRILYAPDYLVNAGGVIRGADFYLHGRASSQEGLARIYDRMKRVLEIARERGISTSRVADELAESRWKHSKGAAST